MAQTTRRGRTSVPTKANRREASGGSGNAANKRNAIITGARQRRAFNIDGGIGDPRRKRFDGTLNLRDAGSGNAFGRRNATATSNKNRRFITTGAIRTSATWARQMTSIGRNAANDTGQRNAQINNARAVR